MSQVERDNEISQDLDEGIPSVNRRKKTNKIVTIAGFITIIAFGLALIVAVNKDKNVIKKKDEVEKVANNLPPLDFKPDAPEPIKIEAQKPIPPIQPIEVKPGANGAQSNYSQSMSWQDRKRLGFSRQQNSSDNENQSVAQPKKNESAECGEDDADSSCGKKNDLSNRMEPTLTKAVSASILANRQFVITKGTSLDCVLETAIDSTVPGLTTCRLTRNVYSDNGQVLLLDRGSMLVGEYQASMKLGQARLFVLWTRVKTPTGVIINLNSPSADQLGRAGMDGYVDTHFSQRFGAAILISLIKDTSTAVASRQQGSGGGTVNNFGNTTGTGEKMAEKALDGSVNIPPTLNKNQGDHIQIMVSRDLDFSTVYELKKVK